MASVQDIYDEITRIDNAKQGIAEAIEEKGVQVPEESRIGEYPGLVRQIQTGSPDAVLYTPQDLTPEQQEQARENIGAGTYTKPGTGIPKTDLAAGVQTSLGKADTALQPAALTPITELIPEQATPENKLADKNFVNSSVATNTANYISDNGQPFQSVADLEAYTGPLTNNDYAFVVGTDSAGNTTYTRYKYNANTQTWAAEYVLNNSSFTAEQWAAISSGITALLVQKLSDLPTEVVTYVEQTLTEAQKQQARTNIGATAPEVFWATYGTTTLAEITTAFNGGKLVACIRGGTIYVLGNLQASYCYFYAAARATFLYLIVQGNAQWTAGQTTAEETTNRVNTLSGNETATNKYPSTKAVADALGKWGVVSQTQTWESDYGSYTISNVVRGLIPQSFIDQWIVLTKTFGGFNAETGYFELNGLADLSYEDALEIMKRYSVAPVSDTWRPNGGGAIAEYFKARTNIPFLAQQNVSIYITWNKYIEVSKFRMIVGKSASEWQNGLIAYGNYRLKRMLDYYNITSALTLNYFYALEECYFILAADLTAPHSKFLSLASVVWMVDNATNGNTSITITLHANAYARCQADTTEYTYNEQTYTGIIAYAAARNITIQSA